MAFEIVDEMNEMARYLVPYRKAFEITGAFHELPVAHALGSLKLPPPTPPPVNLHKLFLLRKLFAIY